MPHFIAVITFAVLTAVYFLPYYQDMSLVQNDITQWEGMSKEARDWNDTHPGEPALWTDAMFGGMPTIQVVMTFSGNFVTKIVRGMHVFFPDSSVLLFLSFVGFYIMLLCFDVNQWLSFAGALAYGLSSFILISIEAGHNTKVQVISLMAPVLGGVVLAYRKNILIGAAVTALFLSMAIDANHLQIAYYLLIIIGVIGLYFLITSILEKQIAHFAKASGALILAAVLAILPNVGTLWSTQEYVKETIRGGSSEMKVKKEATKGGGLDFDYATRWSYGFMDGEILSIIIPNIKGGGSGIDIGEDSEFGRALSQKGYSTAYTKQAPGYWGHQPFTSGPVYFGAAIVFLFILSLLVVRSNIKWLLLALTLFSFLLAFGHNTPIFKWLFNLLPFFNKFRTPAMALVIAELTMPLLAIFGVNEILTGKNSTDDLLKKLKIAGGITAGIVLVFGFALSFGYSYTSENDKQLIDQGNDVLVAALKKDRASLLHADAFRALFFISAAFGLLWFFIQKKLSQSIFIGALAVLFLADNWMVAKRYLNSDNFVEKSKAENAHALTQADIDIKTDTDPDYRVFNVTRDPFNDALTSYHHKSVGGYHPAKLIRYQDLIEHQISKNNMNVLNMLNTKYFIVQNPQTKEPMAQRNPGALGNAWSPREIKWVKDADEEMAALTDFNPRNTVVIDQRYKNMVPDDAINADDSAAIIKLTQYTPNKLTYASSSAAKQLAVFSEIYYGADGWTVYIDGKETPYFRADYVLRALVVPAGNHQIEFKFAPRSVTEGNKIAYAGSFLLFVFVLGILGFEGNKRYNQMKLETPAEKVKPAATPKPTKKK